MRLSGKNRLSSLKNVIAQIRDKDYKVTLGSTLEPEARRYYMKNNFSFFLHHSPATEIAITILAVSRNKVITVARRG